MPDYTYSMIPHLQSIFTLAFKVEKDIELRLGFFGLLAKLLLQAGESLNSTGKFNFVQEVVLKIVVPNCVWVNGRPHAALRTAATSCMWALCQSELGSEEDYDRVHSALMPHILTCLDDEYPETRLITAQIITKLLDQHPGMWTRDYAAYDRLHLLSPELSVVRLPVSERCVDVLVG